MLHSEGRHRFRLPFHSEYAALIRGHASSLIDISHLYRTIYIQSAMILSFVLHNNGPIIVIHLLSRVVHNLVGVTASGPESRWFVRLAGVKAVDL